MNPSKLCCSSTINVNIIIVGISQLLAGVFVMSRLRARATSHGLGALTIIASAILARL